MDSLSASGGKMSVPQTLHDFGSAGAALAAGARRSFGVPSIVLGGSFLGFGALVHQVGLSVWHALFSTATGWALPGQIVLVELYAVGASLLIIALAVGLTNARLLPMTVTLIPLLRSPGVPRWQYYLISHFIAVTGWVAAMRDCPAMSVEHRLPYYAGFAGVLWSISLLATWAGFALAGSVPGYVTLGLVFINPIYFMLVICADVRARSRLLATVLGAIGGPAVYVFVPDWSLLIAGVVAGTLGYFIGRKGSGGGKFHE
jgi:predicted branched-subunit amino acid permease